MKNLLFVSRVAFISNVCMLLALVMRYINFISDKDAQSTIIIAGFFLSFICNLIVAVGLIFFFTKKQHQLIRPAWLFIINFLCLIFQLYFMLQ